MTLNLKRLNQSISYKRFRMESIFAVRALLPQNWYMASLDLKDTYLHVPIAETFQRFLCLAVNIEETTGIYSFRHFYSAYPRHPEYSQRSWQKPKEYQ